VASAAKRPRLSQSAQQAAAQQKGGAGKEPRKVVLPESLRKILVDDNAFINLNQYLVGGRGVGAEIEQFVGF
jgi:hypothetical protein